MLWFKKHNRILLLLAILIFAAYLRLNRIGEYMTFLGDEGRDLLEVLKILSGDLVFLGPRSSAADFYYGPIYFYLITPFLWLFHYDPVGPAIFVALIGIATVYLVYYVGEKLIDTRAGLIAAALYAVSPVIIAYSRSSWNPNPLPFVSLLSLYILYKAKKGNSLSLFLLTGLLMGIAIQLQYLAIFLGTILFFFVLFGTYFESRKIYVASLIKQYLAMAVGFLIGWSPFLAFELRNGFPNIRTIFTFIFSGNPDKPYYGNGGFFQNIWTVFFNLFGRLVTLFPPPEQINTTEHVSIRIWYGATVLLAAASAIMIFKIKNKIGKLLFGLWFFIGIFLFGFYKKQIYDYYLGFMFPLPFLLVGNLLSEISREKKLKFSAILISGSLFLLLFFSNIYYGNPFASPANRQKDQVKLIADFVLEKSENKPFNFALLTLGNSDHAYKYYFKIAGKDPVEIQNPDKDPERKSVTDQLIIVCEDRACQPLGNGLWEVAGFGRAEIAGQWDVSVVKVYKLRHYKGR